MSRSATLPLSVGSTAPDTLSLLHQRLLLAEVEAEALIEDVGALGVSRDQIVGSSERCGATQQPVSPLKMSRVLRDEGMLWKQCDSLVSRVCRVESLLQTLKLTIFRLDTERELNPSHTAHLKQQLAALQQDNQEEQRAFRREAMKLRDQLLQAYQERDKAHAEVQRLGDAATAAKLDVALAAEALKTVKLEMTQKLMEMKEQMRLESACSVEAMKSHKELLLRAEEMERALEMERRRAVLLQSDRQAVYVEVQTSLQQLEEERGRGKQLEECCQQLKEQTAMKDSLASELKTELKRVCQALQRLQRENSELAQEGRELRAAAANVQTIYENGKQQADLKAVRSHVVKLQDQDLPLEAAGRDMQTELQVALNHKVSLQLELEQLRGEHAQILQSFSTAQETAVTQRELLERTIERLRGELSTAKKKEEATRKNEFSVLVTKLEDERRNLETQLSRAKQNENRGLMGKMTALEKLQHAVQPVDQLLNDLTDKNKATSCEKLKTGELEGVCCPAGGVVSRTFETMQQNKLAALKKDRLQAQREIRKHQDKVEKLQRLLTSTHSKNNRALMSVQKALDLVKVENKRLTQCLERAVLTNSKLVQAREQYEATITLRDEALHEAQTKVSDLSEELRSVKQQTGDDHDSSVRILHRETSEQKMTMKDLSSVPCDVLTANQKRVSKQRACIREQRSGGLQAASPRDKRCEESVRSLQEGESKPQAVRTDSQQDLYKQKSEWERWTSTIQRWEAKRELAHITGGSNPVRTQLITQSHCQ